MRRGIGARVLSSGDSGPVQRVGNAGIGWTKQTLADLITPMSLGKPTTAAQDVLAWLEPSNQRQHAGANASILAGMLLLLRPKPVNLPSWEKVTVDMEHIAERHMPGGALTEGRDVFVNPNGQGVQTAIRQAYGSATVMAVQGERVLFEGVTKTGMTVQMWLNKASKVIESAYPVGKSW